VCWFSPPSDGYVRNHRAERSRPRSSHPRRGCRLLQAFLHVLDIFNVVSRHMKARTPDIVAVRRDCLILVERFTSLYVTIGVTAPVFPKLLSLQHFFVDMLMWGDIPGFSGWSWESRHSLFASGAFDQSSGRYGQSCDSVCRAVCACGDDCAVRSGCGFAGRRAGVRGLCVCILHSSVRCASRGL
jgi:hypothetical protein